MVQTSIEIKGERYSVKYQKTKLMEGELYQGILFFRAAIGFSYVIRTDKSIFFDNKFLDKDLQKQIVETIEKKERKKSHR